MQILHTQYAQVQTSNMHKLQKNNSNEIRANLTNTN